jgi:hypothetical protein
MLCYPCYDPCAGGDYSPWGQPSIAGDSAGDEGAAALAKLLAELRTGTTEVENKAPAAL